MFIQLDDNTALTANEHGYQIAKRTKTKDGHQWVPKLHYRSIDSALESYADGAFRRSNAQGVTEAINEAKSIGKRLGELMQEAMLAREVQ